ncbi:hypothetical protein Verru16b_02538 [Lacunisphaera limnophila]|uniref:Uncharacterized protein n=1 Tax=Lacunisphaera limnophila TaxID=1838286 RepID=A0A1D8AX66_9BACT|nr:hypothetical protein [Lacunisphaera limnophila]AOS45457.1 hypothetical protein Verru16b_02538 [Lacunisphaera limnophila]
MTAIPSAELHTPDELLANASAMYASGDPKLFRGAILESITALEAFVQRTVFRSLEGRLDPLLVKWLEEKTRMDFDSRLSVLTQVATGLPINKSSELWDGYKKAKEIRNKVVHSGRKVTAMDVELVMASVRDWLSYLGTTVELEAVLLTLKRWVEQSPKPPIENEAQAIQLVAQYFHQSAAARITIEAEINTGGRRHRADMILDFGPRKVLVETKFPRLANNVRNVIRDAVEQADAKRQAANIGQACVIAFLRKRPEGVSDVVERHKGGGILSIAIETH